MARILNHIAISVTDIYQAMTWYKDVLGMSVIAEPVLISARSVPKDMAQKEIDRTALTPPYLSGIVRSIFGPRLGQFMICHLVAGNGVGIELFEFTEPAAQRRQGDTNFEYWKTGFFHLAITEPDVEKIAQTIAASGGKRGTETM